MKTILLSKDKGWPINPNSDTRASFAGEPNFVALSGPGSLVRLVQLGQTNYFGLELEPGRQDGAYWFDGDLFQRICSHARQHLKQQQQQQLAAKKPAFAKSLDELVGNYVRHSLRNVLAVCYDFTLDFGGYMRLRLEPGDALIAARGPVAAQLAYSPKDPAHKAAEDQDIQLTGKWIFEQGIQYVIDFRFPANARYVQRIHGPFRF